MNKVNISHVNHMHSDWVRAIDFYKQELNILKSRLTEVAGKNTAKDMQQQVEHFENQFAIQAGNLDHLRHDIRENVAEIGKQANNGNGHYIDGTLATRHDELEKTFLHQESAINTLRHDFNRFAATWM